MRTDFVLVRGPADQERYGTLYELAERIHQLRGERALHLRNFTLAEGEVEHGPCVGVKAGDKDYSALIGYALLPETVAFAGDEARNRLAKALIDQKPDAHRTFDGARATFSGERAA